MDDAKKSGHAAAQERYRAKMARMELRMQHDDMRALDDAAALAGQSRTEYILQALRERMERDDAPVGRL